MPSLLPFLDFHIVSCQFNEVDIFFSLQIISTEKEKFESGIPVLSRRQSTATQKSRPQDSGGSCFPLRSLAQV